MEWLILALFCLTLLFCIVFDISVLVALTVGLLIFLFYGKYRGHSWSALGQMAFEGIKTVKNILITFFLIGILTALGRAAGTIPTIVCCSSVLIRPSVFLLMTFLLNCGVSALTGTSFATAATMGAICISMATALHMDLRLVGGAVLSGVYFGDRCSPVSTSAILISELTGTNIFDNIKRMLRSACIPFLLSCVIYVALGFIFSPAGEIPELDTVFKGEFTLHWLTLIPAALILLLSVLRVDVKLAMTVSILASIPICIFLQHITPFDLLRTSFIGFYTPNEQIGAMMNGGGVTSMLKVAGIVCLSSSYSGIFRKTGLLDGLKHAIAIFSAKTTQRLSHPLCRVSSRVISP